MSSFLCSKNHYLKTRDLSYNLILNENKHFCYWNNVNISSTEDAILNYVNNNIKELVKINARSVNNQYNLDEKSKCYVDDYIEDINNIKPKRIYNNYLKDLISLYNAYTCINYQIEIDYNKDFINNIQKLIADNIIYKLNDEYYDNEEVNKWEFM